MVKKGKSEQKAKVVTTVAPISISTDDGKEGTTTLTTYPALQWSSDSSSNGGASSFEEDDAAKVREAFRQRSLGDDKKERRRGDLDATRRIRSESPAIPVMRNASRELLKSVAALHIAQEQLQGTMAASQQQLRSSSSSNTNNNHHHYHKSSSTADLDTRTSISSPGRTNFTLKERFQRLSRLQRKKLLIKADQEHSNPYLDDPAESSSHDGASLDGYEQKQPQKKQRPKSEPSSPKTTGPPSPDAESQVLRHYRQASYNSTGMVKSRPKMNSIKLHVYDLIAKDTLMMLPPFGCIVEIGKCFNEVNSALHQLGTGAYHVGIEINGIEYAYGATSTPGKTGIFSCIPTLSPGYQYRQTIDLGSRPLVRRAWVAVPRQVPFRGYSSNVYREVEEFVDGRQVIKEMTKDYMGRDYDILRKNCCSFARDACLRLGVKPDEIPSWFCNLAESGAMTQDMAIATVQPLTSVLSACEEEGQRHQVEPEFGFEMIARQNQEGTKSIVVVVDARPHRRSSNSQQSVSLYDLRRNATWTY